MDGRRFDSIARTFASSRNRRSVLSAALAGIASIFGLEAGSVRADLCKEGGRACKKDSQCCTGRCSPGGSGSSPGDGICCTADSIEVTCAGLCGPHTNNCGQTIECEPCCIPDSPDVTCAGACGSQTNNCGQTVNCGLCAGGQCAVNDECASDVCCDGTCEDCSLVSPTATSCGGCGNCCECFAGDSFGPQYCCDAGNICGTYPNDVCCSNSTVCVDGQCIKPDYVCPHEVGGESVDCRFAAGAGCCNGLCCPHDKPICFNGACHEALPACGYPDNLSCPEGSSCTANEWYPDGVCCTNMGSRSHDANGTTIVENVCCGLNEQWGTEEECPTCIPRDYCFCQPCTSRTSTPRITT
jgi:hypothetical protein